MVKTIRVKSSRGERTSNLKHQLRNHFPVPHPEPKEAPEIPAEHTASIPKNLFVKGLGVVLERVHPSFLSWYNQVKNVVPQGN